MECIVCKNTDISDIRFSVENRFPLMQCNNCGLRYINFGNYQFTEHEDYWNDINLNIYSDINVVSAVKTKYGKYISKKIAKGEAADKSKLLDIGCGIGTFLEVAREIGFETYGIEPSSLAVEFGRKKGRNITRGLFNSKSEFRHNFQVITLWDVIEHVDDPEILVRLIYDHLCNGGTLLLETPDQGCFLRKLIHFVSTILETRKDIRRNLYYLAHRYYFTQKSMYILLSHIGFQNIKFYRDYTIFEKSILKRKYQRGYSNKRIALNKIGYTIMKWLPIIFANKMVVQATKP